MQFGTFILDLAEKAGISKTDPAIVGLLSTTTIIPDEIASKISDSLFNIDSAKQNSQLKGYFHSQALSVPDKNIEELIESFDPADKAEFIAEKHTPNKIKLLAKKIEAKNAKLIDELQKKGNSKDSQERIDKLAAEITKLNTELVSKDNDWKSKLEQEQNRNLSNQLTYAQKAYLSTKKYKDEKQAQDLNVDFAELVLNRELNTKKAKVILGQDGKPKLVQADNPDLEYQENHKVISFGDFADKTLANHNMLFVTDPKKVSNGQTVHTGNGKTYDASAVVNANTAQIAQLEREQAQ